jgi:hypothetical protein
MESADGTTAKIGACEVAANAAMRLRAVEAKHRGRAEPAVFPLRIVIVAELAGLVLPDDEPQPAAHWAEVEDLESALRLALARRLGARLSAWPEWLHLDTPVTADAWVAHVEAAWAEVDDLGQVSHEH